MAWSGQLYVCEGGTISKREMGREVVEVEKGRKSPEGRKKERGRETKRKKDGKGGGGAGERKEITRKEGKKKERQEERERKGRRKDNYSLPKRFIALVG